MSLILDGTNGATSPAGIAVGNATVQTGGIAFPATQVAVTDVNTLDDYEEGTWTPTQGAALTLVGSFSSTGVYTKIGRLVNVVGNIAGSTSLAVASAGVICGGLPFTCGANACPAPYLTAANNSGNCFVSNSTNNINVLSSIAATTTIYFNATYYV